MDRAGVSGEDGYRERSQCLRLVRRSLEVLGGSMMESDSWPLDAVSAAALVARVIRDIDQSSDEHRNVLLSDLLCAAWPSCWAQDQ
jgi:hypothetical protein